MSRSLASCICQNYEETDESFTVCLSSTGEVHSFGSDFPFKEENSDEENEEQEEKDDEKEEEDEKDEKTSKIASLNNIIAIACGKSHMLCLNESGNILSLGTNEFGQLGIGKDDESLGGTTILEPQKVTLPKIKQISCGFNFSICLAENGDVYSFGSNDGGQLGQGEIESCNAPKKIESLHDIELVECGSNFIICKSISGDVFSWGDNSFGQLGQDSTEDSIFTPSKCSNWPSDIVDIKCGHSHTLVLTNKSRSIFFWS